MAGRAMELVAESFAFSGGRVDRSGPYPVVRAVLLCGRESLWKRRYLPEAFSGGRVKVYEGKPVFLNHATETKQPRAYQDRLGWIENPRQRDDGMPEGDIGVNPKHPYAEAFLWDAEHRPANCSMSHVAGIDPADKIAAEAGWVNVRAVAEVRSVDVVTVGATASSLYSEGGPVANKVKLYEVIESWLGRLPADRRRPARKAVLVMENDASMAPVMDAPVDEPAAGGEPDDALWGGFWSAITAVGEKYKAGEMTAKEAGQEVLKYFKSHEQLTGGKGGDEEPPADDKPAAEAAKLPDYATVHGEFVAEGYPDASVTQVTMATREPDRERRLRYIREQKGLRAATAPKAGGRSPVAESAPGAPKTPAQQAADEAADWLLGDVRKARAQANGKN